MTAQIGEIGQDIARVYQRLAKASGRWSICSTFILRLMSKSGRLIPPWVADWFAKGILIARLEANDIRVESDVGEAAEALAAGLLAAALVEFFVVTLYVPRVSFAQLFGVPAYGIVHAFAACIFVLLLLTFLKLLHVRIPAFRAAALILYALSGLLPFVMLFAVEILNEAISLFLRYRDPSNRYMLAALQTLLDPEHGSPYLRIRVWIETLVIVGFFVYYLFVHLRRLLMQSTIGKAPGHRITVALLLTVVCQFLLTYFLLGRVYWLAIYEILKS